MEEFGGFLGVTIAGMNFGMILLAYLSIVIKNYKEKKSEKLKRRVEIHKELYLKAFSEMNDPERL